MKTPKIHEAELLHFLKQLGTLLEAGLSLMHALKLLAAGEKKSALAGLIASLGQSLEEGREFHLGLERYPQAFDHFSIQLLAIGERSGTLSAMIKRVHDYRAHKLAFKKELVQTLLYPCFVLATALLSTLGLLLFVVPHFATLYAELAHPLPSLTRAIVVCAAFLRQAGLYLLCILLGLGLAVRGLSTDPAIKEHCHRLFSGLPFLASFYQTLFLSQFSRLLAMTLAAALPLSEALILLSQLFPQKSHLSALLDLHDAVQNGQRFHSSLAQNALFPPLLVQLVKTGEEAGRLEAMLSHFAELAEMEVAAKAKLLQQVLPPLIITSLGVLIGIIVVALYLPIFDLGMAIE